jgi:hypothetical protein
MTLGVTYTTMFSTQPHRTIQILTRYPATVAVLALLINDWKKNESAIYEYPQPASKASYICNPVWEKYGSPTILAPKR